MNDPKSVTSLKVTRAGYEQLEALAVDPRTRLDVIAKLEQQIGMPLPQLTADWAALVERTR